MKKQLFLLVVLSVFFVVVLAKGITEGFKNVDMDARVKLESITTKILPKNAICIRGAQCISGKCLETQNETVYGYCQ